MIKQNNTKSYNNIYNINIGHNGILKSLMMTI